MYIALRKLTIQAEEEPASHWPIPPAPAVLPDLLCPHCGVKVRGRPALNSHVSRLHRRCPAHYYARGTVCDVCMTQYTTRRKLRQNLDRPKFKCLLALQTRQDPCQTKQWKYYWQRNVKKGRSFAYNDYRQTMLPFLRTGSSLSILLLLPIPCSMSHPLVRHPH